MKILLILPADRMYRYRGFLKSSITYAPLTLTTLAALVPAELDAEIRIVDEGVQPADYAGARYDVVGMTCVASSAPRAYELAAYWKAQGAFVVLGGAHPTLMPDEALQHADAVVVGPGEQSWPQCLRDWYTGKPQRLYRHTAAGPLSSPHPRRDLLAAGRYVRAPTVIANRGCRNGCTFCSIPRLWNANDCARPIPEVIEEIRALGAKEIILLDPSPFSNRPYAKEFFGALAALRLHWAGLASLDIADDRELFELMVKSGCRGLLLGFESICPASLTESRKHANDVRRYRAVIDQLHAHEIGVLGCFVLGFDHDTLADLRRLPAVIAELQVDLPRFAILTPFPGTPLFARLKQAGRLSTEDWSWYDCEHVVFQPARMTADELQQAFYAVWRHTYSAGQTLRRCLRFKHNRLLGWLTNLGLAYYAGHFPKPATGLAQNIACSISESIR